MCLRQLVGLGLVDAGVDRAAHQDQRGRPRRLSVLGHQAGRRQAGHTGLAHRHDRYPLAIGGEEAGKLASQLASGPTRAYGAVKKLLIASATNDLETQSLLQTVEGREIRITARFYIDPVDNGGAPIDPQADDWLQYTDFAGDLVKQQRIVRVSPWWICGDLDYLELEIGRM